MDGNQVKYEPSAVELVLVQIFKDIILSNVND